MSIYQVKLVIGGGLLKTPAVPLRIGTIAVIANNKADAAYMAVDEASRLFGGGKVLEVERQPRH